MKTIMLRRHRWLAILLGAVVLVAMVAGLRRDRSHTAPSHLPVGDVATILVVPFAVLGTDNEPWSGAGLAEEVRAALAADSSVEIRRSERPVVSGAPQSAPDAEGAKAIDAARRVGADYVLTGTVGRGERGGEIGLRLVRAADASTAWTGTFWRSSADFPSFPRDLAAAVSEAVRAQRDRQMHEREAPSR